MQRKQLKNDEDANDRQQGDSHFSQIFRQALQIGGADGGSIGERRRSKFLCTAAFGIKEAEDQHGQDRPDRTKRHQAKAVGFRPGVAADIGNADAQRQNKGDCHGTGGHAAGIKRHAEKIWRGKGRQEKDNAVKGNQQPAQMYAGHDAQHAHCQEKSDAKPYRDQQDGIIDVRDSLGQYL